MSDCTASSLFSRPIAAAARRSMVTMSDVETCPASTRAACSRALNRPGQLRSGLLRRRPEPFAAEGPTLRNPNPFLKRPLAGAGGLTFVRARRVTAATAFSRFETGFSPEPTLSMGAIPSRRPLPPVEHC